MKSKVYVSILSVLILLLLHFVFINGLEKMLFHAYADSPHVRRPECPTTLTPVRCLGMPSGHVEITTLVGVILFNARVLSLPVLTVLILGMALQRVLTRRHTLLQTFVGFLFGLFYALAYLSIQPYQLCLTLFFLILYVNLLLLNVENHLNEKAPDWVNPESLAIVQQKKNVPYYFKCMSVIAPSFQQERFLFMSWNDLEQHLDTILQNIQRTGIRFDAVVGIKSGGAILSDYISRQLRLPNYKIKVSRKKYQCEKGPHDFVENHIDVYVKGVDKEYMICEGIPDDLVGKNVILIDELVSSGQTMNTSIDYLIRKEVKQIYPVTIQTHTTAQMHPRFKLNTLFTVTTSNTVWPWGYDN